MGVAAIHALHAELNSKIAAASAAFDPVTYVLYRGTELTNGGRAAEKLEWPRITERYRLVIDKPDYWEVSKLLHSRPATAGAVEALAWQRMASSKMMGDTNAVGRLISEFSATR